MSGFPLFSVSVVMAVYNGGAFLRDTITSILHQTLREFEFIIINDGSTDETSQVLSAVTDPRIIVINNRQNRGLAYSLNEGLARAQGKYIARIDAGDLAAPERLERQAAFLDTHPEVGILGTGHTFIDEGGQQRGMRRNPIGDLDIRWTSLLKNPFFHPTVMLRREVLCRHHLRYDTAFQASQDYDLWTRMLQYTEGANLNDVLLSYRKSHESITATCRELQLANHDLVAFRTICRLLPELQVSQEHVTRLREAFVGGDLQRGERKKQCAELASCYLDILSAFAATYSERPGIQDLQHREALRIALIGVRFPSLPYWLSTLSRALHLYPGGMFSIFAYIVKKHLWKRGQHVVRQMLPGSGS
jgi:glycosyltransferase involved in cell wall biosynthesis